MSVLGAAQPTSLSSWLTDASARFGLPRRTLLRRETHQAHRSRACPGSGTLIPLAQHVNRILTLLTEEVIRDEPASPPTSSRCVSTAAPDRQDQPGSGGPCVCVAEPVATDANADRPDMGRADATDATDGRRTGKGDGPC